jgi:hypothetical protein
MYNKIKDNIMTKFNKEKFRWDGMYLMYDGSYEGQKTYDEVFEKYHPDLEGVGVPLFVARFKYGSKPWKSWRNFLCKNSTVEQYVELSTRTSPLDAMESMGFVSRRMKLYGNKQVA